MDLARVDQAMQAVRRADFLPLDVRRFWAEDRPLPIGRDATNSQPSTVRHMLGLLGVPAGARVLDVGSGSGWTTALLARLAAPGGHVLGVELAPELVTMAREHLVGTPAVEIRHARPGVLGLAEAAPFDRILVSADHGDVPAELVGQLTDGGRMVLPAAGRMLVITRHGDEHTVAASRGCWSFVPLR